MLRLSNILWKMKHARKMVLVDVNTLKSKSRDTPSTNEDETNKMSNALNTLVTLSKFNTADYGPNASKIAKLDKELKEIMDQRDLDPTSKLKHYNQKLQHFLHLLHKNDKDELQTPASISTSDGDDDDDYDTQPNTPANLTRSISKPVTSAVTTPVTRKPYKSNLPRLTPIERRLRATILRQKNSRYKDFLKNWTEYGDK